MDEIMVCPADVKMLLHEEGILRENEKAVMLVDNCVLLERDCGERLSYRVVNVDSNSSKYLFTKKEPLRKEAYENVAKKMSELGMRGGMENAPLSRKQRAERLLEYIFDAILPQHGMQVRNSQKELALVMLDALAERKIALCEAQVGTGKTHAYILAVTVYNLFAPKKVCAVISTSTIALQKALTEIYIPQISGILMEHCMIEAPLSFVVRKGKGHYVCDHRLARYMRTMREPERADSEAVIEGLKTLQDGGMRALDLDRSLLPPYIKGRVNVSGCNDSCPARPVCRYMKFQERCRQNQWDFQILNHNYLMADIMRQGQGDKALLPAYGILVADEAHKILDTARQMYRINVGENETERLMELVLKNIGGTNAEARKAAAEIKVKSRELFDRAFEPLEMGHAREEARKRFFLSEPFRIRTKGLAKRLSGLAGYLEKDGVSGGLVYQMKRLESDLEYFSLTTGSILWLEKTEQGCRYICAVPQDIPGLLYHNIWKKLMPVILTSGTMSVSGDFDYFKTATGLKMVSPWRLVEVNRRSPFDFCRQGLLYIPEYMPFPNIRDNRYMKETAGEIRKLVLAIRGHTLILFTSYWLMERLYYMLKEDLRGYPLFLMQKGRLDVLDAYRNSGNGVLFASDSAGEGLDLPGDILSGLIIVKLPFPVPDPIADFEKEQYEDFDTYREKVIVPEMLIKLRQWIGRGIRTETDTTVFSILDSRAALKGRYRLNILDALPDMAVTDRLEDVESFILKNKKEDYFNEVD